MRPTLPYVSQQLGERASEPIREDRIDGRSQSSDYDERTAVSSTPEDDALNGCSTLIINGRKSGGIYNG